MNQEEIGIKSTDSTQYLNSLQKINLKDEKEIPKTFENPELLSAGLQIDVENEPESKTDIEQNREDSLSSSKNVDNDIFDGVKNKEFLKIELKDEDLPVNKLNEIEKIEDRMKNIEENKINLIEKNKIFVIDLEKKMISDEEVKEDINQMNLENRISEDDEFQYRVEKSEELEINVVEKLKESNINIDENLKNLNQKDSRIKHDMIKENKKEEEKIINFEETLSEKKIFQEKEEKFQMLNSISKEAGEDKHAAKQPENIQEISSKIKDINILKDYKNFGKPLIIITENQILNKEKENVPKQDVHLMENSPIEETNIQDHSSNVKIPIIANPLDSINEKDYKVNLCVIEKQNYDKNLNGDSQDKFLNIGIDENTAIEEHSYYPISIDNDLKESRNIPEIFGDNEFDTQINLRDVKEPIMEHKLLMVNNETNNNTPSHIEENLKPYNLIELDTLNNGLSIINNEIITDITENAFEAIITGISDKTSTKTVEAPIHVDIIETNTVNNIDLDWDARRKKEKAEDKIISVSIPDKTSDIIASNETKIENAPTFSEIVSLKKLEEEEKNIKKIHNQRGFFDKYAPWLFISIGGAVMSYFIYRRFAKYK